MFLNFQRVGEGIVNPIVQFLIAFLGENCVNQISRKNKKKGREMFKQE